MYEQQPSLVQDTGYLPEELVITVATASRDENYNGKEGSYNINNGTFCAVIPDSGRVIAGYNTERVTRLVEKHSLMLDENMVVPFAVYPLDNPELGKKYNDISIKAALADKGDKSMIFPEFLSGAHVRGDWLAYDGLCLWQSPYPIPQLPVFAGKGPDYREGTWSDKYGTELQSRFDEVGLACINNGIISFVDGRGDKWVAPQTYDRVDALRESGYIFGFVGVPLSNGERIMNPEQAEKWQAMKEDAREQMADRKK